MIQLIHNGVEETKHCEGSTKPPTAKGGETDTQVATLIATRQSLLSQNDAAGIILRTQQTPYSGSNNAFSNTSCRVSHSVKIVPMGLINDMKCHTSIGYTRL
eukprot:GHVU01109069.1.p3 GENE.GHVU01109069.1~~GHVU01109069.1.p3  ORF type:complete len:102 (+),score=3.78 GHVU01109069.1:1217-1522(+)